MRRAVAGGGANAVDAEAENDGVRLLSASFNQDRSSVAAVTTAADFRVFSCSPFREELRRALPSSAAPSPARPLRKIPTALNPRGLCCLSCHVDARVLACPGTERGEVRVDGLPAPGKKPGATRLVAAHGSDLACMALAVDGAVLATASVTGTLVRVFSTADGACLQQVRRGADSAEIYSVALSPELRWLAVCSVKGTLHVFSLRVGGGGGDDGVGCRHKQESGHQAARSAVQTNTRSSLSFMKGILPGYFSSEWSFAQFRLPETTRYVTAFGEENTVMIIGMDGSFHRCSFDPVNGKEMVRKEYFRFLKNKDSPPVRTLTAQAS